MPAWRNTRLEQMLGGPIDHTLTYAQVSKLIPDIGEDSDLDFKRDLYAHTDRGRKGLAVDAAAFGNAQGGLLILGLAEDDQGRATTACGVDISDAEQDRIRQIILSSIFPKPIFGIIAVPDPDRPGLGFLLLWIARSADAPHAVKISDGTYHYPKRLGKGVALLAEAEIAESYRARFTGFAGRLDEAERVEAEFQQRTDPDQVWLIVTLVPDLPGHFDVDQPTLRAFERHIDGRGIGGFGTGAWSMSRAGVRRRRLTGTSLHRDRPDLYTNAACELHENGSGTLGVALDGFTRQQQRDDTAGVSLDDEATLLGLLGALEFLGDHARSRAHAAGLASVRATIVPQRPQLRDGVHVDRPMILTESRSWSHEVLGRFPLSSAAVADTVADIDDLASPGPGLIAAAARLAGDLWQEFGVPEASQLTADGALRPRLWTTVKPDGWAQGCGVELRQDP